jgi:hypothetical protein
MSWFPSSAQAPASLQDGWHRGGIAPRILDAIQGQAARFIADTYGDVTVNTMAREIGKLPRIAVSAVS